MDVLTKLLTLGTAPPNDNLPSICSTLDVSNISDGLKSVASRHSVHTRVAIGAAESHFTNPKGRWCLAQVVEEVPWCSRGSPVVPRLRVVFGADWHSTSYLKTRLVLVCGAR